MSFRVQGLAPEPFQPLYGLSDAELAERGARRMTADRPHAFPDRIALRDAEPGEAVILLNHTHQPADTPYRASHAIFVLEGADAAYDRVGPLPEVMRRRLLSLRAFDARGEMLDADVIEGADAAPVIDRLLDLPRTAYIQAHYAKRGCYAARITRA